MSREPTSKADQVKALRLARVARWEAANKQQPKPTVSELRGKIASVMKPVKHVVMAPVTKSVTPVVTPAVTSAKLAPCPQCLLWEAEVKMLKRELAKLQKPAMTGAERMRQLRAKRKQQREHEI